MSSRAKKKFVRDRVAEAVNEGKIEMHWNSQLQEVLGDEERRECN